LSECVITECCVVFAVESKKSDKNQFDRMMRMFVLVEIVYLIDIFNLVSYIDVFSDVSHQKYSQYLAALGK